jgi:hypothetical protein
VSRTAIAVVPLLGLLAGLVACGARAGSSPPEQILWTAGRMKLRALRADLAPNKPYKMALSFDMHEPVAMSARGAVAVRPSQALRMILLGPGGTTAFDLWMCGDAFKISIPAIGLEQRGDVSTSVEDKRGLPVGFLRWWLLQPLSGRLINYERQQRGGDYRFDLMNDGVMTKVIAPYGGGWPMLLERSHETMSVMGPGCAEASYTGDGVITLNVSCESLEEGPPPAKAFNDPDDGTPCPAAK